MADLRACYFCGSTEGPPSEHPVVPPDLDVPAGAGGTVVVCESCREKLVTVQGMIADAVDADPTREEPDAEPPADPTHQGPGGQQGNGRDGADLDGETEGGEAGGVADLPDAANEIGKLLRNREFPVDRDEFEAIATSAYDITPAECREAVDAFVAEGVVREEEGELRRPGADDAG